MSKPFEAKSCGACRWHVTSPGGSRTQRAGVRDRCRIHPVEQRVFGCIRRAYVEVRYGNGFRISDDELAFAFDCTRTLSAIVERVCANRLTNSEPVLAGTVNA